VEEKESQKERKTERQRAQDERTESKQLFKMISAQ
jgi:hypothetical protein